MADVLTPQQRTYCMSRIKSKDTKPELVVRRLAHDMGYRFRLHRRDLPGTPDLVFPKLQKAIYVHGCFWHLHFCRYGRATPKKNAAFWRNKRVGNRERDRRHLREMRKLGWRVLTIWECQIKDLGKTQKLLLKFLLS